MFTWIKRLLRKNEVSSENTPLPEWQDIVDLMYDQNLDSFQDEVVDVLYSKDRSMRYVITKDENGLFWYCLETIYQFDDDEWAYMRSNKGALPAMWESYPDAHYGSVFDTKENVLNDIHSDPYYKNYFA